MDELKRMGWVVGILLCLSVLFSDGCYETSPAFTGDRNDTYAWKTNKFTGKVVWCIYVDRPGASVKCY